MNLSENIKLNLSISEYLIYYKYLDFSDVLMGENYFIMSL